MTRGILLAGNESILFSSLAAETEKRVEQYASAIIPDPAVKPAGAKVTEKKPGKGFSLSWNPGSPVSCRSLLIAAENRMGQINDALLICSPPPLYRPAADLLPFDIETFVNNQIKGWVLLVRELSFVFRQRRDGTLALIVPEPAPAGGKDSPADLLGAPAASAFRYFAQALLSSSASEPYNILGFTSEVNQEAEFAAWLYKIIDEGAKKNSGKFHKFGKFALFR
jgi:hypothetical protein